MKAIEFREYGTPDQLQLVEVERPTAGAGQLLVRMAAASLNSADWRMLHGEPKLARPMMGGLRRPARTRLGSDGAGTVEAVGEGVSRFAVGDRVFGDFGGKDGGSCAEWALAAEKALAKLPAGISFEHAAATPMAGMTALQALRDKGQLAAGQRVLIHGAGGGVGTFAVQIALALGGHVTAVCGPHNVALMQALGAQVVIDYTREDALATQPPFDLILGVNGYRPMQEYRRALTPTGAYLMVGGSNGQLWEGLAVAPLRALGSKQTLGNVAAATRAADLETLAALLAAGKVTPVIDRCFPLAQAADAMRYLGEGHARGKVVISTSGDRG